MLKILSEEIKDCVYYDTLKRQKLSLVCRVQKLISVDVTVSNGSLQ